MGHDRTWQQWWDHHKAYYRTAEKLETFEASGFEYVEQFLEELRAFAPGFSPTTILDFGCGVGRILAPMGRAFPHAHLIGVDISDDMFKEAGISGATFVNSTRDEIPGGYDLLHSFIVFQHIPLRQGLHRMAELVEKLKPGGIGAIHVTYALTRPFRLRAVYHARRWIPGLHDFAARVMGKPRLPFTLITTYPVDKIMRLLQAKGCHRVGVRFSDHDGYLGVRLMFEKKSFPSL